MRRGAQNLFKLSQESGATAPDSVELLDGGCQRQPVGPVCRNARTCSDCSFISLLLCASSFCTSVVALQCLHACMQVQVHACIQEHTHTQHTHIATCWVAFSPSLRRCEPRMTLRDTLSCKSIGFGYLASARTLSRYARGL